LHELDDRRRIQILHQAGLRRGLSLIRGMRRALTEDEQDRIAGEVAKSLRHGWKIERIQPQVGAGHSGFAQKKSD
jgi:hypothetical protein